MTAVRLSFTVVALYEYTGPIQQPDDLEALRLAVEETTQYVRDAPVWVAGVRLLNIEATR